MEEIYKFVGKRIREERKVHKITQERLAELTCLSPAFIGQIERGHNRASLYTIEKIAKALNIPIDNFFTELYKPVKHPKIINQLNVLLKDKSSKDQQLAKELVEFILNKIKK